MGDSLLTELSFEDYVDRSLVPSTVIRLPVAGTSDEKLWIVAAREPELILLPVIFEIPEAERTDPGLRARLVAVTPEHLSYLTTNAWIDCNSPHSEFSYNEIKAILVGEPTRIVGNFRKQVMLRVGKARSG